MSNNEESHRHEELQRATTGFNAAISLWKLSSQQIYSRFSAMLIANSIVFGAASFTARGEGIPTVLLPILCICGLVLCGMWFLFMEHGLREEKKDMDNARKLQEHAIPKGTEIVPGGNRTVKGHLMFRLGTYITIFVFVALYSSVLCYSFCLNCSYLFGLFKG